MANTSEYSQTRRGYKTTSDIYGGTDISRIEYISSNSYIGKKASKKSISILDAFCIVFGTIVGAGIFKGVQEPYTIFESDDITFVMIFWALFGIISIFGGLCYAELGTRIPQSGGDRAYLKEILNKKFSKVFIIFFVFIIKTLCLAGLAITLSTYFLNMFVDNPDSYWWPLRGLGFVFLTISTIIVNYSKKAATKTGVITTILKILAMLAIITSGIYSMYKGNIQDWNPPFKLKNFSAARLGMAMMATFWAHDGGNTLGLVAGDMVNPARDLPIAIALGMGCVVIIYVLTVISYPTIIGYAAAKTSTAVAYECAKVAFGKFAPIMSIFICFSVFGSMTSTIFSVSSASTSAGVTGELPKIFSLVHKSKRTPFFSSIIICIISGIFTLLNFNMILGYVSFTSLIFYSLVYVSLWVIKIKTRHEDRRDIFRIPYILIIPVQLLCLSMIIISFYIQPYGSLVISALLAIVYGLQYVELSERNFFSLFLSCIERKMIYHFENNLKLEIASMEDIS